MGDNGELAVGETSASRTAVRWQWFCWWWALAVLMHAVQAWPLYGSLDRPSLTGTFELLGAGCAVLLLVYPVSLVLLGIMSMAICGAAWSASPVIGNHWMVNALLALALLLSLGYGVLRRRCSLSSALPEVFLPTARGVFFVFYTFSALSKINRAFLDPAVSCATFFTDETARSLGWKSLDTSGAAGLGRVIAVCVIVIELGVVVLLSMRRTRPFGVLLAVVFHSLIGLDGLHPFADFTSIVYALMVLFLPDSFFEWIRERAGSSVGVKQAVQVVVRGAVPLALLAMVVARSLDLSPQGNGRVDDVRDVFWRLLMAIVTATIVVFLVARRGSIRAKQSSATVLASPRWLLVIPVIALLNGITPYVGVKTVASWNMYSNLVTAKGYENGLLIPTDWQWRDSQNDLVRIVNSSDPGLQVYAEDSYVMPFLTLRAYTASRPDISLTYVRATLQYHVTRVGDDPDLARPVPGWLRKLASYRSFDGRTPARCEDRFLPAA